MRKRLHQNFQRHLGRLPPIQYGLDDLRRQQDQPQHATDVGRVDIFFRGEGSVCDQSSEELCPRSISAEPIRAVW